VGDAEAPVPEQVAAIVLPAQRVASPFARRFVRARLGQWGLTDTVDVAELLTSELVGNAVGACSRAGPRVMGFVRLDLTAARGRLRVEVTDGDPRPPVRRDPAPDDENGRGLLLVDGLADRWGHYPARGADGIPMGKTVWFELATTPPPT
jgi:anti-sigma regulatory factor (Ser/Thr protein kinase)